MVVVNNGIRPTVGRRSGALSEEAGRKVDHASPIHRMPAPRSMQTATSTLRPKLPVLLSLLHLLVDHRAFLAEALGLLLEARLDGLLLFGQAVLGGVVAHFLGDLH